MCWPVGLHAVLHNLLQTSVHSCRPATVHSRVPASLSLTDCAICCVQSSLSKLLLFERLDKASQIKVVEHTWTRKVSAGEILIQEGETGLAASELYVVKDGAFEVRPAAQSGMVDVEKLWS